MTLITWHNEKRAIRDLIPYVSNPRQITDRQAKDLKSSLERFGIADPIIINTDNIIIGGHQRKKILETLLGYAPDYEIDVRVPDRELTIDELRELNIRLNKNVAEWDFDTLANNFDLDDLLDWGFEKSELDLDLWTDEPLDDPGTQIDKAEELREKWGVETGQLWQLGDHRLICGDCTDKAVVERVTGRESADMCFTSPPYATQRDYEIGDFDWNELMIGMSQQLIDVINEDGAILINLGLVHKDRRVVRYWDNWLNWMDNTSWPLFDWYVWDKLNGLMGDWHGRLAPAHEWIFHFANNPRSANKTEKTKYAENGVTHYKKNRVGLREKNGKLNGFTQAGQRVSKFKVADSVIRCQPARGGVEGHPAPFSVEFAESLIISYSKENEIVYEPFLGSGTTLIACERLNRKCRAVEISPGYVAVAIQRWVDMTGGEPVLLE